MKNIEVYLNRSMPAAADIEKHMDFAKVFKQFQKLNLPFYKQAWFKWGLATVLVTAGITLAVSAIDGKKEMPTAKTTVQSPVAKMNEETPCINPPVDGGRGQTETFFISSTRDTVIYTSAGSKLHVPADLVGHGKYELRVREFDKTSEIFLSGIPMDYDSAGNKYAFESAGMMEIMAYQNNKPVLLKNGKNIKVEMKSTVCGSDFNVYYLDTLSKKWTYEGRDKVTMLNRPANNTNTREVEELTEQQLKDSAEDCRQNLKTLVAEIDKLNSKKPIEPNKADTSSWYFDIKFNPVKFPEMKAFKNAHFQVLPECTFFNQSFYSTKWQSIKVKELVRGDKYLIHVERKVDGRKIGYDIPVKPVYEGKSYDSAYTAFSKAFDVYKKDQSEADRKWKEEQARLRDYEERVKRASLQSVNNSTNNGIITVNQTNNNTVQNLSGTDKVMRTFTANRFGVWNCDRPLPYKRNEHVEITARDITGSIIKEGKMYVSDVGKRAIFTYAENERMKVGVEGECQYIIWIVDKDEQLHFARMSFSDNKLPESKKVELNMAFSSTIPSNALQLKKLLGI